MSDSKMVINDNLVNLVSGLGTERAKSAHSHFTPTFYTNEHLLTVYRTNWLAAKIIDIPAEDATREWRAWQAEKDQITKIEKVEKKYCVQAKVEKAIKWARLYGGACIYIGTNASDLMKPLNVEREKLRYLTVMNSRNVTGGDVDYRLDSEYFGQPSFYRITTGETFAKVHPSRLVRFFGKPIPDDFGAASVSGWGWGDSILMACMAPLLRTESTMANAGELMFESQVDVIKVPGLFEQVGDSQYRNDVLSMISLQTQAKGITKTLLMDKEQDYESHNATFAGVPELIAAFHQEMAGASDIPATRLLGQSPSGLNSTGESDLRNHYDSMKAYQNLRISPAMNLLDEMMLREALGRRPEEVHYNWVNLWGPSAKEQAEIGKMKADTIDVLNGTGLFPSDALSAASVNMLVEGGVMPGLENAMDQYASLPENDEDGNANLENTVEDQ